MKLQLHMDQWQIWKLEKQHSLLPQSCCGKTPVSEAFPGWPLIPGGPPREKIVSLLGSLDSQLRLPVRERIKGCTVGKGHGLVTGLIGSEVH